MQKSGSSLSRTTTFAVIACALAIALGVVTITKGQQPPNRQTAQQQWTPQEMQETYKKAVAMGLLTPAHEAPTKEPTVITPGANVGDPPSDAIVLFNGKDLAGWRSVRDGGDAKWTIKDGYMEVAPRTGDIATKEQWGDCQLHVEWAAPSIVKGESQGRGNSGIFLMERYEVQVLDSFNNKTYFHGQAGSIYKQHPPLVNVARKPGEWQSYDIIFTTPRFDEIGNVTRPARVTVLHNGVVVQNNAQIYGHTWHDRAPLYIKHDAKGGLKLQDHGDLVRYRNIWVRPL